MTCRPNLTTVNDRMKILCQRHSFIQVLVWFGLFPVRQFTTGLQNERQCFVFNFWGIGIVSALVSYLTLMSFHCCNNAAASFSASSYLFFSFSSFKVMQSSLSSSSSCKSSAAFQVKVLVLQYIMEWKKWEFFNICPPHLATTWPGGCQLLTCTSRTKKASAPVGFNQHTNRWRHFGGIHLI